MYRFKIVQLCAKRTYVRPYCQLYHSSTLLQLQAKTKGEFVILPHQSFFLAMHIGGTCHGQKQGAVLISCALLLMRSSIIL